MPQHTENTNHAPPNLTYWSLVVSRGDQGIQGIQGLQGVPGLDGKSIRYGSGAPGAGLGNNGDFYINTDNNYLYGPKFGGAWSAGISLVGPQSQQGQQGIPGQKGDHGNDGNTILYGAGALQVHH